MRMTRREFAKLAALSVGAGVSAAWGGLPQVGPVAGATAAASVALDPALPLHPLLQYGVQLNPKAMVRVIVQTTGPAVKIDARTTGGNLGIRGSGPGGG